jgi:hypothetical protein
MATGKIERTSGETAEPGDVQVAAFRVMVEEGADPRLQEWVDQLMADPDDDPDLFSNHDFRPATVTAEQVYALLNEFIERRPYGPENPPPSYAESVWLPGVKLPDDPNEPIEPGGVRHNPDEGDGGPASRGSRKHNAKHRRLGMFHR